VKREKVQDDDRPISGVTEGYNGAICLVACNGRGIGAANYTPMLAFPRVFYALSLHFEADFNRW
jgi:hypothetical protein